MARFSVLCLAVCVLGLLAMVCATPEVPQGVSPTELSQFRLEVGKRLGPVQSPLLRILSDFENGKGPMGAELAESLTKEYTSRATKFGKLIYDFSRRLNDVLGRVVHSGEVKPNFVKAEDACPVVVDVITKMVNSLPLVQTVADADGSMLHSVLLLGDLTSYALSDLGCRKHFPLVDFIATLDRAKARFVDGVSPALAEAAATQELWADLRASAATYITSVDSQLGADAAVALDGLNNPSEEEASLAMMQAAAMADLLDTPAEPTPAEDTFAQRVAAANAAAAPREKDEL